MSSHVTISCIQNLSDAETVWKHLTPDIHIDHTWEYRYAYYKYFQYDIYFYTAFADNEPVAVLPLEYNKNIESLIFFGGPYMNYNDIFTKKGYEYLKKELISHIDKPATLNWLVEPIDGLDGIEFQDYSYSAQLNSYTNYGDYIENRFSGKSRRKKRTEMKKIFEDHSIEVKYNISEDFDYLIELNKKKFGEQSSFNKPYRIDFFRDIMNIFPSYIITVYADGKKAAASYASLYNGIYYGFNSGIESNIRDLGKLVNFLGINHAIELGAHTYDAKRKDMGWKEQFRMERKPLYQLSLSA
jgi:hypothetical protein